MGKKVVECPNEMMSQHEMTNICNYGSTCIQNQQTNLVHCECQMNCERSELMALCGSDGVTYESLCHLKRTKCLQQRPIKIINHDTCGSIF